MSNDIVVKNSQELTNSVVDDLSVATKALMSLAMDKDFDVEKMKAIMDMQISMIDRKAKQEFNQDFFALKEEIPVILQRGKISVYDKDKGVSKTASSYAKLEDIQEALEPLLKKYRFILRHGKMDFREGKYFINTTLSHIGGHEETVCFISPPDKVNSLKGDMQAVKSTVSYGRRVNLINLFDLKEATSEDSAMYQNQKITLQQAEYIDKLIEETNSDRDKLLAFCNAETSLDISVGSYNKAITILKQRIGKSL